MKNMKQKREYSHHNQTNGRVQVTVVGIRLENNGVSVEVGIGVTYTTIIYIHTNKMETL